MEVPIHVISSRPALQIGTSLTAELVGSGLTSTEDTGRVKAILVTFAARVLDRIALARRARISFLYQLTALDPRTVVDLPCRRTVCMMTLRSYGPSKETNGIS